MSSPPDTNTLRETAETAVSAPLKVTGRYVVVRKLGKGGLGSVFLVEDTHRQGEKLALKRVRTDTLGKKAAAILRNEFTALATLEHPNLARVYDFGVEPETADYFFTSEFVDGVTLFKACADLDLSRAEDLSLFIDLLAQVVRALEYIHSRGLVHGDIKPENILVTGLSGESARVKLIDFGLTRREKEFGGKKVLGTTYYIAPETIIGAQVDRRTDLYSLGAVVYHLITGRPPFQANSHAAILKSHVEEVPAHPSNLRPQIPAGLGNIVLKLLEKRPVDRYPGGLSVIHALNSALALDIPFETKETAASYLHCSGLVSRDAEIQMLHSAFHSACRPDAAAADADLNIPDPSAALAALATDGPRKLFLIRGEKGLGKRRLALELKKLVQTQGAPCISIECAGGSPRSQNDFLQLMKEIVAIARHGDEKPAILLRVASLFRDDDSLGPSLSDIEALFDDLSLYVLRLTRSQPLAIHLHDVHRGGKLLLSFLQALLACHAESRVPDSRLLLTASALDRIDCESTDLHELLLTPLFRKAVQEICLVRLDAEGVGKLLQSTFTGNEFPAAFTKRVFEESDGNPGVIREICEFFLDRKVVRRTLGGWTVEPDFESEPIPGRVRLELEERMERLPEGALRLALAFAVLGDSTPLELAVKLSEVARDNILESMQWLYRGKVLREDGSANQLNVYSFVHATARDILYNRIPEPERRTYHDRAGALCESYYKGQGRQYPERIAVHYIRAGNKQHGIRYGIEAAESLGRSLQPSRALAIYSEVLRLAESEPALSRRVRFEMGRLENSMGRYGEALETLVGLDAPTVEGGIPARSQLLVEIAASAIRVGRIREAAKCLDRAYAVESAQVISGWMVHVLLGFADLHFSLGKHEECLRSCEKVLKHRSEVHDTKLLCRLYALLAESSFALEKKEEALQYCREALVLVDSRSDTELFDSSLYFFALSAKYKGKLTVALKSFELCAKLRKQRGLAGAEAEALLDMGSIEILLWHGKRAVEKLEAALALFEKCGDSIRAVETLSQLAEARRMLGEYEDSMKAAGESLRKGKPIGLRADAQRSLIVCGKLCIDRGDFENAGKYFSEAFGKPGGGSAVGLSQDPLGGKYLQQGDFASALDAVSRGIDVARQSRSKVHSAQYLEERAFLYGCLGKHADMKPLLITVFDLVKRMDLRVLEGRADLLQGVFHTREGAWNQARKSFDSALQILKDEGSERDLLLLYVEKAEMLFRTAEIEEAFLCLDEAFYIAKKLNLLYWKCRIQLSMGGMESALEQGDLRKAEECLRIAEKFAAHGGYLDLFWQIRRLLGDIAMKRKRHEEALSHYREAERGRDEALKRIPESFHQSYLDLRQDASLRAAIEDAVRKRGAALEQADEPKKTPDRPALDGSSPAMAELFQRMETVPPEAPWIWICGQEGSGKRTFAAALHKRLATSGGHCWSLEASELKKSGLMEHFQTFEAEREKARRDSPWWYPGKPEGDGAAAQAAETPAAPPPPGAAYPRYTMVLAHVDKLPLDAWKALLLKVKEEQGIPDGLRVIATAVTPSLEALDTTLGPEGAPVLQVPPLSARMEDLEPLVTKLVAEAAGGKRRPLLPAALKLLEAREWKENVRELKAFALVLAVALPEGCEVITPQAVEAAARRTRKADSRPR